MDVLWHDSNSFSRYGIEVGWYHYLFQLCTTDTVLIFVFVAFPLCIMQGNLDVLQCDGYMLGMYGVEVKWYHFLLCFPFVSAVH